MPRASYKRKLCKRCGGHRGDVGHVTWRGYCGPCGRELAEMEVDQLHAHSGPYFEAWRRAHAAAVGAVLLEDLEAAVAARMEEG